MNNEVITLNTLWKKYTGKRKAIYWIESYPTLRKWVMRDYKMNNILGMQIVPSEKGKSGKRYVVSVKNINAFIKAFQDGSIYAPKEKTK